MTAATVAVAASAAHQVPKPYAAGLVALPFTAAMATTQLDDVGDITELGYLPANCTVIGFIVTATDMDTGTPALVYKLTAGSTDLVTGITTGQSAGTAFFGCTPTALTAVTKLQVNITTVSATAAAGTLNVVALYING